MSEGQRACELGQRLRDFCAQQPDKPAYTFYRRHNAEGDVMTWQEMWAAAAAVYAALEVRGVTQGQGVFLFCEDERAFIVGLIGTWMAGAVAIPASGNFSKNAKQRNDHILKSSKAEVILHDLPEQRADIFSDYSDRRVVALHEVLIAHEEEAAAAATAVTVTGDGSAAIVEAPTPHARLLQYTSGSTTTPKPVLLDASTIAVGCRTLQRAYGLEQRSVGASWLPLHHDMGLVGFVFALLWVGGSVALMKPSTFIQKPAKWLEIINRHRATITAAPNFAFDRLCAALSAEDMEGCDLSCLETLIFGGEPVRLETYNHLVDTLEPLGLRRAAIAPSYGLAEVMLLASSGQTVRGPAFSALNSAAPVANLGQVVESLRVTILDSATGGECAHGQVGQIYLNGEGAGLVIRDGEDWRSPKGGSRLIDTGDLGFLIDNELYITGRNTNKIIVRGKNFFTEDIEALILNKYPNGSVTGIIACCANIENTDTFCILIEWNKKDLPIDIYKINEALLGNLGIKPDLIATVPRFSLPRTSSGKIKRQETRDAFEAGLLKHVIQRL